MRDSHDLRRLSLSILIAILAGCSSGPSTPLHPIDLSSPGGDLSQSLDDLAGSPGDMAGGSSCNGVYSKSTIAAMRQGSSGCYELDSVVSIAVTPVSASSKTVTIYAQDAGGGDYSAVKMGCSSTSTAHLCAAFTAAKAILAGRTVTVSGTYIKSAPAKGGFEEFYIDSITDTAAGTAPTPATLTGPDLERSKTTSSTSKPMAAYWFQIVTANISDKLLMFDWTPPELKGTGSCPQFGFGMIPTSASATAGAACSGMTQPAGQASVNPKEVLVDGAFYGGFTFTTDCKCAAMYSQPLPTAGQGVSGTVTALLNYDVPFGTTTGYQFLDPLTNANFMIQ